MGNRSALDVAMDLFHRPAAVRHYVHAPLPEDVLTVIRIAAGGEIDTGRFDADQDRRTRDIREACIFFVQQILFHARADSHRMLGLNRSATPKQVQDHKRMLLKWLHPDRNPNKWEQVLFQRVIRAAAEIESQDQTVVISPPKSPSGRRHIKRGRLRPHYAAGLQRVALKGWWRVKIIRYSKRGLLAIGLVVFVASGFRVLGGGDPWDISFWREINPLLWGKLL